MSKDIRLSLFAGLLIGLGAYGFLALGGIPGAVIFAFGLVGVVLAGANLYTGKAGVLTDIGALALICCSTCWPAYSWAWLCFPSAENRRNGRRQ